MRRMLPPACAMLMMLSLSACGRSGVSPDVCPAWLRAVAPIHTQAGDTPRTERRVFALNEAGQAVGCW